MKKIKCNSLKVLLDERNNNLKKIYFKWKISFHKMKILSDIV